MLESRKLIAVLFAILIGVAPAFAQNPPLPPMVIINGSPAIYYAEGGYFGYDAERPDLGLFLSVASGTAVSISRDGYWTLPGLLVPGYDVPGYWVPGYWLSGYWIEGYWSDGSAEGGYFDEVAQEWVQTGTWIPREWYPETWVEPAWVDGYYVEDYWSPVWVGQQIVSTGTYSKFAFQMTNGFTVVPANLGGIPWSSLPSWGIPAIRVNNALWQFSAANSFDMYDYFSSATGDGYLWMTPWDYGGYDPQLGAFSGTNSNGYFRDTSASTVKVVPKNSNGSFLRLAEPVYGPSEIWSNGWTFQALTTDAANAVDVYVSSDGGYVLIDSTGAVTGLINGQYAGGIFQNTVDATFAAAGDGSPLPVGAHPLRGPAALLVSGDHWRYRGSKANVDYYGGAKIGSILTIDASNVVTYTDKTRNFLDVKGYYAGGVFQNLPSVIRPITLAGDIWSSLPANSTAPASVIVNGTAWYYSSTESAASGSLAYVGAQRGQTLWIDGTQATISDPTIGLYRTGSYLNNVFTFSGAGLNVRPGNTNGTPLGTGISNSVIGDFDVTGNSFSLGTWIGPASLETSGFGLTFTPPAAEGPASMQFGSMVAQTDWLWTHAVADGGEDQKAAMKLDSTNRLILFDAGGAGSPKIILDPGGRSRFSGAIRIEPQGDISMGPFTAEPAP